MNDVYANKSEAMEKFKLNFKELMEIKNQDAIVIAVKHKEYMNFNDYDWSRMLKPKGVLIDVKSIYDKEIFLGTKISYWSL